MTDPRRSLPGVDQILSDPGLQDAAEALPRSLVVAAVRGALEEARTTLSAGASRNEVDPTALALRASELAFAQARPTLRPVINATGVILHTNLGRAPLAAVAIQRMAAAAEGYTNLEFDLGEGVRGSRYSHCGALLCELTGAEDALVVNNCAAALILALNTAARGEGVVVSRGELIEIGGGFRIPEIVERAGTRLVEVGTTNRTRLNDYEEAVTDDTGALLKVHRSNFRIEGFSEEVDVGGLRTLATQVDLPLVYDLGSGLMLPLTVPGLPQEPTVPEAVTQGTDLIVFSGDKLLGGPQAGIIVGSSGWMARVRKNPLTRALRVDRLTLTALEATLELYRDPARARTEVPTLRMIHEDVETLHARAERLAQSLPGVRVMSTRSVVGGGTLPGAEIPSWGIAIDLGSRAQGVARALRLGERGTDPIVPRVQDDAVILDLRTVEAKRDGDLERSLRLLLR